MARLIHRSPDHFRLMYFKPYELKTIAFLTKLFSASKISLAASQQFVATSRCESEASQNYYDECRCSFTNNPS
jgi:hypothetical protein